MRSKNKLEGESLRRREVFLKTQPPEVERQINLHPLKYAVYLLLLGLLFYAVFYTPTFKIKEVRVEGVKSIEISDYLKTTLIGKNILFLRPGAYLNDLAKKFPILEEARMIRGLPATVRVIVAERRQQLVWCSDKCFDIDSSGYAYQEVERPTDKVALVDSTRLPIKVGDRVTLPHFIKFFLDTIDETEKMGLKVTEAQIDEVTAYKITYKTSEGWNIIVDSSASFANQMSALQQVLDKNRPDVKEYVDLRVEGLAFLK